MVAVLARIRVFTITYYYLDHRIAFSVMSRLQYHKPSPYTYPLNPGKRWVTSLGIWGIGAGTAALLFMSVTPVVKKGLLIHIPLLGNYYEDQTPASDKPF